MTTRVVGTALERARDDERPVTVLISDLHVPLDGGPVQRDLEQLLAGLEPAPHTRLLILGDLFDFSIGPKQLAVGAHRAVVTALRGAVDRGVSVTLLHGNRDFMLGREFAAATGARVVAGGLRFRLGTRECLALHGDELCLRDLPYQRSKPWLRHGLTRFLLRRLPLGIALWVGRRAGQKSRDSGRSGGDPLRYEPVAPALRAAFATGCEVLVFGHIHRPARGDFESRGEYLVLPAFDAGGIHLRWDGERLGYHALDGGRVADYPARSFPEWDRMPAPRAAAGARG